MTKKLKYNKIIISLILSILVLIGFTTYSEAASFSITSGISKITVGKSYTITIKATGLTGKFNITHSSNVSVNVSSVFVDDGKADSTIKVTTKEAGKATVTLTPDEEFGVSDSKGLVSLSAKTDTVTVEAIKNQTSGSGSSNSGDSKKDTTTKPTFTSKNESVYATDDGINVRKSYSTSSSVLGSLSEGESLTRTGIATEKVNGILWSKVTYKGQTAYVSSSYLTTTKPVVKEEEKENQQKEEDKEEEKSNNTNLKTLEVTPTGLSPAFTNVTTEYTMTVGSDIDEIKLNAVAEDEKAKVSISGNDDLEVGTNTIKIKVTAEDETEKTYVITVTKEDKEQLKLSELLIEGLPLEPGFDENVYEYSLTLDRSDVSELNITATPNEEDAEIEIVGNTDLKPGENVITILVKSSDGEEITTYQITANIPETMGVVSSNNEDLYKYIGIAIAVIALIIIILIVIRKSNKNKEDDYADYSELYNRRKSENIDNDINLTENKEEIKLEDLPELADEDLPKSLRKEKFPEEKIEEKVDKEIPQENLDRIKKIDKLYSMSGDVDSKRKRGKHF